MMWLALIAVAAGCGVGIAAGGRLTNLRAARLRWLWLLGAGAACEAVADKWISTGAGLWLVIVGYALMVSFAVGNLPHAGSVLIAAGLFSNLLVIGVNAGMPVRGVTPGAQLGGHHHGEENGDRLTGLADEVYVPPLGETLSAGDFLLAIGVGTMAGFAVVGGRRPALAGKGAGTEAGVGASA
ncbi:MAG TPA: DUF5317 family protein [Acidimicrobiales bacterium]|nr:DUF5317 family protein [Acidimicrobiales bacterium]